MSLRERLVTLNDLLSAAATNHEALQRAILQAGADALGMDAGGLGFIEGDTVVPVVTAGAFDEQAFHRIDFLEQTFGMMMQTGASVTHDGHGFLGTPLESAGQQYFVCFMSPVPRVSGFSEEDRIYVEVIASFLARLLREQHLVEEITHLRFHDRLTGLALETPMRERLAAATVTHPAHAFAVFAIDIDITRILEQYDYEIAARLVSFAALRLQAITDHASIAYRGTACDFFIVSSDARSAEDVAHVASRIQTAFATPFSHGGSDVIVSVNVGVALFPTDAPDAEQVIAAAVNSVKLAKAEGKSMPAFAAQHSTAVLQERRNLSRRLKNAIENNELVLYYQPYIDLKTREPIGAEALVRWRQPDGSLLPPDNFLPMVEGTDAMLSLGSWVMAEAARMCRRLHERGRGLTIAFNVSPSQLQDAGFIQRLKLAMAGAGPAASMLEIEITESAALSDPVAAKGVLLECRRLGLKIALDDFGTGYSSLVYLRELPADVVKIDRSFVGALPADLDCSAIAGSIIALAHRLGRLVQAEGIEDDAQWDWLREEGCDLAQGFRISHPLPENEFLAWLPQSVPR